MSGPVLRSARPEDVPAIEKLLVAEFLPAMRITEFLDSFWVLEQGGELVGAAGIEVYGDAGFLRSVVVVPALRGTGEGARLVSGALEYAKQRGVRRVYLFTMNAAEFFARFGFAPVEMDAFEEVVRESWQYGAVSQMPEIARRLTPMRLDIS
jgi:amino-acid N-acetyltransferase